MIPTEDQESINFASWLRERHLKFAHINNELLSGTYHKDASGQVRRVKNWKQLRRQQLLGSAKGLPDYLVAVDPKQSADGEGYLLWIEMKRTKGGHTSVEQKEWMAAIGALNLLNVQVYVAKGCKQAIEIVCHYLGIEDDMF